MWRDQEAVDRIIRGLYDNPFLEKCAYFNKTAIPTWDTLDDYARANGIGVRDSACLPASLLGLAVKRRPQQPSTETQQARHGRHDFYIVLNSGIPRGFAKFYVAAHELGHVLMHARLLSRPSQLAFATQVGKRGFVSLSAEIEASAFALIVIVPDSALATLEKAGRLSPRSLSDYYRETIGMFMPESFACDRIAAYQLRHGRQRSCARWCFITDAVHDDGDTNT